MTKLKSSGLILIALISVSLVLFSRPSIHELQTNEVTQKIAPGSSLSGANPGLSPAANYNLRITEASSVDEIFDESNDVVEGLSGLDNVTGQQSCDLTEYYCDSSDADLHRLISIIESSKDNELLHSLVKKLWYMAADLGAPEPAISALKYLSRYADENISDLATHAYNDLIRLSEKNAMQMADGASENTFISHQDAANITGDGLEGDVADAVDNHAAQTLKEIQELRMSGLNEHQAEKRIIAVRNLLRYRHVSVIDALIDATYDTDNRVRRHAVNALWIAGSDSKNDPGLDQVLSVLKLATIDTDPEVGELAVKALKDIQRNQETSKPGTDLITRETIRDDLDVTGTSSFQ